MGIYLYKDEDKNRMGHCDWLPKDGDLCVYVERSGECFADYVAIRINCKSAKYRVAGKFGY